MSTGGGVVGNKIALVLTLDIFLVLTLDISLVLTLDISLVITLDIAFLLILNIAFVISLLFEVLLYSSWFSMNISKVSINHHINLSQYLIYLAASAASFITLVLLALESPLPDGSSLSSCSSGVAVFFKFNLNLKSPSNPSTS
jgi:hypothetical protein